MQTNEQIERVRTLYSVMVGVPEERVFMTWWRSIEPHRSSNAMKDDKMMHDCRTMACGMGWACAYPEFKDAGLYMVKTPSNAEPYFEGSAGFSAADSFFGMSGEESLSVFGGDVDAWGDDSDERIAIRSLGPTDHCLSNKARLLRRLRRYLLHIGAITVERNAELAKMEGSPE